MSSKHHFVKLSFFFLAFLVIGFSSCRKDNLPPKACLLVSNNYPALGESVRFSDCSEDAYQIEINFGDGTYSNGGNIDHVYNAVGEYLASLKAYSKNGKKVSESIQLIFVGGTNPGGGGGTGSGDTVTACFTVSDTAVEAGTDIDFANCSQNATSFAWNFGDGSSSVFQNPSHSFTASGKFTVTLIASNSNNSDTTTTDITVGSRFLTNVIITSYNPTKAGGDEWDALPFPIPIPTEPDVFITLTATSGKSAVTSVESNLEITALPFTWDLSSEGLELSNENWEVLMEDQDQGGTSELMMSWENVNLGTLGSGGTISLSSGSFAVELQYTVK